MIDAHRFCFFASLRVTCERFMMTHLPWTKWMHRQQLASTQTNMFRISVTWQRHAAWPCIRRQLITSGQVSVPVYQSPLFKSMLLDQVILLSFVSFVSSYDLYSIHCSSSCLYSSLFPLSYVIRLPTWSTFSFFFLPHAARIRLSRSFHLFSMNEPFTRVHRLWWWKW